MVLARVKGTVVSTHKPDSMQGLRLLLLEKVDAVTMKGKGDYVVAIDSVGANAGEVVFYVTGSSARMTETTKGKPSDATIIAIVDVIEKDGACWSTRKAGRRMNLARVRGTVVASKRSDGVKAARWLLVEECDQRGGGQG